MCNKSLLVTLLFINILCWNQALADSRIVGKWSKDDGSTIEVLDGFQVSTGPILRTDPEGNVSAGSWKLNEDKSINLKISYSDNIVEFIDATTFKWGYSDTFTKSGKNDLSDKISLKDNPNDFISELVQTVWSTTLSNKKADFSTTFTNESGVVEFTDTEGITTPSSWSIASDVLKLGGTIIVEASISSNYFIGLDTSDNFIVFKSIGKSSVKQKTAMSDMRDEFFNEFLTGSWETAGYYGLNIYKFRPIYGELKGRRFHLQDNKLEGYTNWEYSPSTGALKIYSTEYIQATVVGNNLALLNENGDQSFYTRSSESDGIRYTLADVKKVPLNENSLAKIEKELSSQFQYSDYLYLFEFSSEKRTGFVHKFRSSAFSITGETFDSETIISDSSVLYMVEDFVLFDDNEIFKRDASHARLKVKSQEEVEKGVEEENKRIEDLSKKQLLALITLSDGNVIEVPLGIQDLDGVKRIELVVE